MNTTSSRPHSAIFQSLELFLRDFPILGKIVCAAAVLSAPAAHAAWNDPAVASNLQAMAQAHVNYGGLGAGFRVEDAAQGTGTVVAGLGRLSPAQAVRPTDRFRIASCSKTFTAAAIFLLKEQGLLDFDVAISNYLPQFAIPSNGAITIRHLLTHTSGLPDHNNETAYFDDILATNRPAYFSPTQILAVVSTMTNNFAPGEKWKYCDTGFYLLHLIIENENTNGWTFPEFVEHNLIEPLGLTNTFVPGAGNGFLTALPGEHMCGYLFEAPSNWVDWTVANQSFDMGCGGMVSSLEDMCAWARALYTGQAISTNSLAEMLAVTPQSVATNHLYGMGVGIYPVLGYGHGGATAGYFTHFSWEPLRQTAYASVVNVLDLASGDGALNLASQAKRILDYPDIENSRFSNTIAATTALITNLVAQHNVPALSIELVDGTNVVWAQGFGMADREHDVRAGYDTLYRLASLSKAFAGLSAMRLQEDGLADINAHITNSIRDFAVLPRFSNETVTIRALLAHQAGLPDTYFKYAESTTQRTDYYAVVHALMKEDYLNFAPGFIEKYNNNGPTLIEGVVAGVYTNTLDYRSFAASRLFAPMGMNDTLFTLTGSKSNRLARIYKNDILQPDEYVNTFASGGIYSCVKDLGRWIQFLLGYGTFNGVTVLSSNSMETVWSDQSAHTLLRKQDGYNQFGLGWDQIADPFFSYAGRACWKYGSASGYGSIAFVMPERGLGVVVLNSISGATKATEPAARMALQQALLERDGLMWPTNPVVFPASAPTMLATQALADISGHYSAVAGFDLITGTVAALTWIQCAHSATPVRNEGFIPHEDGWFRSTNEPGFELAFTNVAGRVFLKRRTIYEDRFLTTDLEGERFVPAPLDVAWSNRATHTWVCNDFEPGNYLWLSGAFPELLLDIADGVLSVRSFVGAATLQPQSSNLAYPFAVSADSWALQVRETNGHEIIRYGGLDFQSLDDLAVLQAGTSATGTLAAEGSALYRFTITDPIWHNLHVRPTNLVIRLDSETDLSTPGTYAVILQNPGASAVPFSLRLYNLTGTIARVSALVTNLMASNNVVGCGISLVDGARTVWETGFGYADLERDIAVDKNTVFMIGSCSKTFGAMAAMQLAEQGRLDLDAPFTNALPTFSIHQRFAGNVITPRTILTHHSGMPGDVFNHGFTVRPNYSAPDSLQTILLDDYTLMPTNAIWAYNNSGFVMLGQAFRHITGMELAPFARTNLFDRVGMTNSSIIYDRPHIVSHLSKPYAAGILGPDEYCDLFFAGSIYSTSADMARYMRMLLAGGMGDNARVLSNATLAAMTVKQNSDIPLDQFNTTLNMGIGFVLDPPTLKYMGKVIWHDGGTVYFRTLLRVAMEAQLGCFISFNCPEGEGHKEEIVNGALKWAYEEKTGIVAPAPVDPGTPAPAVAPPEIMALATGGVFVTGAGYDRFAVNETGLVAHFSAHADSPSELPLVYRENGWFTPTNAYAPQYTFTQLVGRTVCLSKNFQNGVTNMGVLSECSVDLDGFDPAWSDRLGRWWVTDMDPNDISWLISGAMCNQMLDLYTKDNMLLVAPMGGRAGGSFVLSATNATLAFAAGLGRNKGSALRVSGSDDIAFMGNHFRAETNIPVLLPGAATNGTTLGDEIYWFRIAAPTGRFVTIDLAAESELTAYLYDTNVAYLGQANRAHAFYLDASNALPLMAAVVRNGTNVGPWRFALHTNAPPFYIQQPPALWPADLVARSNLYGDLDFGHVFVRENRTNDTGNLLKIAVARMKSPNPSAQALFFCHGGPGDSGIRTHLQYYLKAFTNDYDVYLIDQRGIGYSHPELAFREGEGPSNLQYRIILLQGGDLSALNTVESSRDLDDLAAAFDLTNANLYAVSYGTLLVQTLMRREPDWLRAVILDGVMAPNITPVSQTGPIHNNALNALFGDVAAQPPASVWYDGFPMTFYTVATNLQDHPASVYRAGVTQEVDGLTYLEKVLRQMTISDLGRRERIPAIAWRALQGDTASLAELYVENKDTNVMASDVINDAMKWMVLKHDILPFDSLEAASNACANLPPLLRELNLLIMQSMLDGAALYDDLGRVDPAFTNAVVSAIPTLVMNGTYDTQTGTNWAAEVARHLLHAHLVFVPTVGHGTLRGGDCPIDIMRAFLADPASAPDTSCIDAMAHDFPPPWPTNASWLVEDAPITNTVDDARSAVWYRFAAASGEVYSLTLDAMPGSYVLYAVDTNAQVLASVTNDLLDWLQSDDAIAYLWMIPRFAGLYNLQVTYPLLVRGITGQGNEWTLNWQSQTDGVYQLWRATNLLDPGTFDPIATNLDATGRFTLVNCTTDVGRAVLFLRKNE